MKKIFLAASILFLAAGCSHSEPVVVAPSPTPSTIVTPKSNTIDGWQNQTDQKNGYSIKYPNDFMFTNDVNTLNSDKVNFMACLNSPMIGCVFYSGAEYNKTNLDGAGIIINIHNALNTEEKCYNFSNSTSEAQTQVANVNINGVAFKSATGGGGAAGHFDKLQIYRNFNNGTCYEISQVFIESNINNFPAGTIKQFNENEVWQKLQEVAHTFEFTDFKAEDEVQLSPNEILVKDINSKAAVIQFKGSFVSEFEGYFTNFDYSFYYPGNEFKLLKSEKYHYALLKNKTEDKVLKIGFYSDDAIGAAGSLDFWNVIKPCQECRPIANKVKTPNQKDVLSFSKNNEEWVIYPSKSLLGYIIVKMVNPDGQLRDIVSTINANVYVKTNLH